MAKRKGGLSAVCFEYRVICPDEAPQSPSELIWFAHVYFIEYDTSYLLTKLEWLGVSLK